MMMKKFLFVLLALLMTINLFGQKIDTDSLLVKTTQLFNVEKNYQKTIKMGHLGIKEAPNYLDFHMLLGRAYMITKATDSARFYFNHVIDINPKYTEAFAYLTKLEIEAKDNVAALTTVEKGLALYPEEKEFYMLKLQIIELDNDDDKSIAYLNELIAKFPEDNRLKQQLTEIKTKSNSDRLGINYNLTNFSRDGIGPWHLIEMQYIRQRKKITVIGQLNYAERNSFDTSISGLQYQMDTYFATTKKSYSYASAAFSNDNFVFPKLNLAYSFYYNFSRGWEGDLGMRYTKTIDKGFYSAAAGVGKYIGSYWINLKSYLLFDEDKSYPALTFTARYYLDTRYDYVSAFLGYGTSPDERITIGQFQQRIALNSHRIGVGYNRLLWNNYIVAIQTAYNRQEYQIDNYQNEFNTFISIQYKF
jgi:YaiO family outer membrane protein